ncbi:hypothetical protein PFICI_02506 [Pestalotiopsis fici W106-1]|uniref:Uncharacterized protein n=1 Tax=Pestalotiopsis fici (strain W106-1 / CGMCC3.15140) TaxID=1229662 RepID=W3XGX7_PESFW|nr:uncharacterized protein PFICI_02506 [Pestalotiopsis fici W106-1]ETS84481.1 hypothetical protein PFICI_02506 [Pestalotiopsis fici W106-1]
MSPTVILMRHAQGYHNLGIRHHHLVDPALTPTGEQQCRGRAGELADQQPSISLVAASPLTRTLQTAMLVFERALALPTCADAIVALPTAQESFDYPFNTGSDIGALRDSCAQKGWPVDLSLVEDGWTDRSLKSPYFPAGTRLAERARRTRLWLKEKLQELVQTGLEDATIALVTHGNFLHFLTDDWEAATKYHGTGWKNCEYRSYSFEPSSLASGNDEARLVETERSRRRRGLSTPPPSMEEQKRLFYETIAAWHLQGLPDAFELDSMLV